LHFGVNTPKDAWIAAFQADDYFLCLTVLDEDLIYFPLGEARLTAPFPRIDFGAVGGNKAEDTGIYEIIVDEDIGLREEIFSALGEIVKGTDTPTDQVSLGKHIVRFNCILKFIVQEYYENSFELLAVSSLLSSTVASSSEGLGFDSGLCNRYLNVTVLCTAGFPVCGEG
jgi:hypothetical protein